MYTPGDDGTLVEGRPQSSSDSRNTVEDDDNGGGNNGGGNSGSNNSGSVGEWSISETNYLGVKITEILASSSSEEFEVESISMATVMFG